MSVRTITIFGLLLLVGVLMINLAISFNNSVKQEIYHQDKQDFEKGLRFEDQIGVVWYVRCIDGIEYLTHNNQAVVHISPLDSLPMHCAF